MTCLEEILKQTGAAEYKRIRDLITQPGTDDIGRILRAHLVVENRLQRFIQFVNPSIPLDKLELRFRQLVIMYRGMADYCLPWLADGMVGLNALRNKLAHQLSMTITPEHLRPMANVVDHVPGLREPTFGLTRDYLEANAVFACELFAVASCMLLAQTQASKEHLEDLEAQVKAMQAERLRAWEEMNRQVDEPRKPQLGEVYYGTVKQDEE